MSEFLAAVIVGARGTLLGDEAQALVATLTRIEQQETHATGDV